MIYQPESFYSTTLASAITAIQTTINVITAPNITSGYLVLESGSSNREIIKYTGVSGTTLTGVVRGLATYGSDDSAGTGSSHAAGVEIANKDVHYYYAQYYDFLTGTSATGANSMRIGDGAAVSSANRYWYFNTSSVSGFWGLSSSGKMVFSEDGVNSYALSAGAGSSLTAGEGVSIVAGAINAPSPRCRVRCSAAAASDEPVRFNLEDYDIYGEMTSASFTAASNGIYKVYFTMPCDSDRYWNYLYVKKNGDEYCREYNSAYNTAGTTFPWTARLETTVPLSAGEYLTFHQYHYSSGVISNLSSANYTRLEIIKLI